MLAWYIIWAASYICSFFVKENWKKKGAAKKKQVEDLIPTEWLLPLSVTSKISETSETNVLEIPGKSGILTPKELEITEKFTATQLLKQIHAGRLSSTEVTTAFCKRAAIAHQLTNCCSEFMFDEALQRAGELDKSFKETGKITGPLHGLPISLKDTFNIKGFDSAIGYVSFIGNKTEINRSSDLVDMLLDLGAVLYVKTNVPQTLITPETDNHVMGRCLNPLNTSLTSGGSSGGECSLIKQRGSILGVGTDVGGSIRIPSLCCGTYGFKPTTNRFPYGHQTSPGVKGRKGFGISPTAGPIANAFDDLILLWRSVMEKEPWNYDSSCFSVPTGSIKPRSKLKIGVIVQDDDFPVSPPIKASINEAASKLAKKHEVIFLDKFPSFFQMWKCCLHHFLLDTGYHTAKEISSSGEPPISALSNNNTKPFGLPPMTMNGISEMTRAKKQLTYDWNQVFIDNDLDILISPGAPFTAPPHDSYGAVPYTANWNLVNFPCAIIPYGKVEEKDVNQLPDPSKKDYGYIYAKYDQLRFTGGTGHVQLTCRYLEDDKLLAIGKIIDSIINEDV